MLIETSNLRGDFFGGLTAAVVALPLALAFGLQSGMGAIAGLYGAIAIGMIAAWFGGTPTQISGPTGPMTVVSAVIISSAIEAQGSLNAAMATIIAIFLLSGIFQILLGVFKIGHVIRYIPYPVVSGFMSGIGVIIILLQIFPFFGHPSPKNINDIFIKIPTILQKINVDSVVLALATIIIIYLFPKLSKIVPSTLIALIVLTITSTLIEFEVTIIGDIPEGLPQLQLSTLVNLDLTDPLLIIIPAITLAALGAIDSLLTSIVADKMTKTEHRSNKELIGQGLGNMAVAAIGGIPGAGATMRTVVNINSGGITRLSGIIHSLALLIVLLGAGAYAKLIPLPVLAGILITVGIGIIDYKGIKDISRVPIADSVIMLVVLSLTVFVDLLQAVAVGLVLASILFMKKMSDIATTKSTVSSVEEFAHKEALDNIENISEQVRKQIYLADFDGPIFFGFTAKFRKIQHTLPTVNIIIMQMSKVPYIDQSGIYAIEDAILALREKGVIVLMTQIQQQPETLLKKLGVIPNLIPEAYLFADFHNCIQALEAGEIQAKHVD